jgi:hypothetical protein
MFAILDKAMPDKENTRGLNMAAVKHTTVQVTRLPLQLELVKIGQDRLYRLVLFIRIYCILLCIIHVKLNTMYILTIVRLYYI